MRRCLLKAKSAILKPGNRCVFSVLKPACVSLRAIGPSKSFKHFPCMTGPLYADSAPRRSEPEFVPNFPLKTGAAERGGISWLDSLLYMILHGSTRLFCIALCRVVIGSEVASYKCPSSAPATTAAPLVLMFCLVRLIPLMPLVLLSIFQGPASSTMSWS